jgi:enoyl-CoA hydratase/carnithine racemase
MPYESMTFARDGHVAIISFNRPEKLNAWAWGPTNDLCAIAEEVRFDPSIRAVLLRGEGRAFCAGEDLRPAPADESMHGDVEERHPGRSAAERTHIAYGAACSSGGRWSINCHNP